MKTSRILLIPLFLILIVGTIASVFQSTQTQNIKSRATAIDNCTVPTEKLSMTPAEQTLFDQINQFRQQNNIPGLGTTESLKKSSAWLSIDMLNRNVLSHTDSLGRDTATRLGHCGVPFPSIIGELIDSGSSNPSDIITVWTHSAAHTSKLLNPNFTHMGVSLATSTTSAQAYWTVTFSGPNQPTPTVQVATPTLKPTSAVTPTVTVKPSPTVTSKPSATPTLTPKPATPTPTKPAGPTVTKKPSTTLIPIPSKPAGPPPSPTPYPTIDPKFVQNPDDTQIYVSVKINGVGPDGNKTPKHQTRRIQAAIYDTENREVKVGTADLRFNGEYFQGNMHMGKMDNGVYSVKISGLRTLKNVVEPQFQRISSDRLNVMPVVLMRQGDVSEDNALTLEDYNLVLECFQTKECKRDAQEFIDFNDSGAADVVDYNIFLQSFSRLAGD